jgi:hypothetical protein
MEPPSKMPTTKFDPLRKVVIFCIMSVDPLMLSTVPKSVVIGGTKKLIYGLPSNESGEMFFEVDLLLKILMSFRSIVNLSFCLEAETDAGSENSSCIMICVAL